MKISIGNDHAGVAYKDAIIQHLELKGHSLVNYGTNSLESVDYADFVHPVAEAVESGSSDLGIIICGSGNGASMTANKHQKIRCALCWNKEIVSLARLHNDANILSIPARYTAIEQVLEMVDTFLETEFEGGRHSRRISKIACS
tara:strand:+ start:1801 stop:2232 length:432 start_codon:yes stop_codon:yes gene_type:complete